MMKRAVLLSGLTLALGACSGSNESSDTTAGQEGKSGEGAAQVPETPTYYGHIAPIYARRCVACHQEGGAGPFGLDSYATAKSMAAASAHSVKVKSMPPWLVREDGKCGEYKDSQALTAQEIETIQRWVDTGAQEGTRVDIDFPPIKTLKEFVELTIPKYTPESKGGMLTKSDEYRCFLLKNPSPDKRRYLNGYEVLPGNAALVHHAVMFMLPSEQQVAGGKTNAERVQELDAQSPDKAGWPCYGTSGEGTIAVDLPVVWAPGQGAVELAPKTGSIVDPKDLLVLQIHYNLADPKVVGQSDQTKLRVRLIDSIERQAVGYPWDDLIETLKTEPAIIPPGESAYVYQTDKSFEQLGFAGLPYVDIQGFMPHMHEAGRSQRLELIGDAAPQCLSDVPVWNFDWQLAYFYKEPVRLKPGERLRNICTYNTEKRDKPTSPGWGTRNEMCLATMYMLMPAGFETR